MVIKHLKIWNTLDLKPALVNSPAASTDDGSSPAAVFTLTPLDRATSTHKGSSNVLRTEPPSGVSVVNLDAIDITLTTSTLEAAGASTKTCHTIQGVAKTTNYLVSTQAERAESKIVHSYEEKQFQSGNVSWNSGYEERYQISNEDQEIADHECNNMWDLAQSVQDPITWLDSSQSNFSSQWSYPSSISLAVNPAERVNVDMVSLEYWSKLADAALRTIIGGPATIATQGIKLSSNSEGHNLAEVAPALFSPGYAAAVSQRSILFPAIARGLSAIYGRTRSANLKAKIEGLTQLSLDERLLFIRHDPNFEDHGRTSPSLIAIVKLRLWKLAQSKLFDRRSTRQLKPTDNFSARSFQGTVTDAMLDEADSMIDEMASLADELDIEAISKPFGIWKELSEINMEDSSFLPENSADCFNDLLDTHESADLECLMLDDVLLGADTSDGDDEFPWDDELLYEDTDPFQNSLQEDAMQDHWQDLDVDLFQNEQYPHTNDDGFY